MFERSPDAAELPGAAGERPPPWLAHLNGEQRRAATHAGGPLLVLAGAGTGKTTTLCARVAWLLSEGVPAERILLLTFTRRAAREMIERARALVQRAAPDSGRVMGGTFHSFAHRMVRMHASSLGLPDGFGLLDAGDAADLLDLIREERGHARRRERFPLAPTMLDIYSRTVNAQTHLAQVLAEYFPWCAEHREALAGAFADYGARKRELGLLDLDDLLVHWRALAQDEVIGRGMAESFDHLLVDEYQDVNGLQADIVRSLRRSCRGVTAVGDDFQAIYGFRAASASHILDFPDHFPGTQTITLEHNYRSTQPILAVANAVSAQDRKGFAKTLWSDLAGGQPPELVFIRDESAQAVRVCDSVLAAREEGLALRAQAVLFRTAHDSDLLELELTRRRVPFVKYGGLRYLDAAHVKDLLALARLATNPADEVSWFRVLRLLEGVGPVRARRILEALRPARDAAPQLARWPAAAEQVPAHAREAAAAIVAALTAVSANPGDNPGACVEQLCAALAPLIRLRYPDAGARLADFEQLAAAARASVDIRQFVADVVLDPPASSADLCGPPRLDEDYLVLSTIHSAKGLEWEAVHLIAAYDGNIPADMNAAGEEGIAEERRLLYVALTRARRRLHVYVPVRYYHRRSAKDDRHGYGRASRYLTDPVQSHFTVEHATTAAEPAPGAQATRRRIDVSVEHLFA